MEERKVGRRIMEMEIPGKRKRGRSIRMWMDNIREDIRDVELEEDGTTDRGKLRKANRYGEPT